MADYIVSDTSLTAVADAIRANTGKSGQMAFPNGFVSEIEEIGTRWSIDDIFSREISGDIVINTTTETANIFENCKKITGVTITSTAHGNASINSWFYGCTGMKYLVAPLSLEIGRYGCQNCTSLTNVSLPEATVVSGNNFQGCTSLVNVAFPRLVNSYGNCFNGCTKLESVDYGGSKNNINETYAFRNCAKLGTLILRGTTIGTLANVNAFTGTPFASGGTGGTIYIPKVLYDELGTGSTLDYKAATNWSIIDGYGTVTWAQIEGSIYETQYADGTPYVEPTYYDMSTVTWSKDGSNNAKSSPIPTGTNGIRFENGKNTQLYNADTGKRIGDGYLSSAFILPSTASAIQIWIFNHWSDLDTFLETNMPTVRYL